MEMIEVPVSGESDIGHVRRTAQGLATDLGFGPTGVAELAIATTELATNLVVHKAVGGVITLAALGEDRARGIEIASNDRGPGIADIGLALRDRASTRTDSLGSGLGAVGRLVDRLDFVSTVPGGRNDDSPGTIIVARKWLDSPPVLSSLDYSVWTRPIPGLTVNGDATAFIEGGDGLLVAVADGLGHGAEAALASEAAIGFIRHHHDRDIEWLFDRLHGVLRSTRGAAIALARIELAPRRLIHAAVGNVEMRVDPVPQRHHAARPGVVGVAAATRPKVRELAWPKGATLALYSDGIAEGWNLGKTAAHSSRRASLMCHLIARDHARSTDDATVAVVHDSGA